jgi:DNA-directed RNA polymerase
MMEDHPTATPAVDAYNLVVEQLETNLAARPQFRHIKPTRELVKMPTSTYFYGASNFTMADQIEEVLIDAGVELPDDPTEARKLVLEMAGEVRKAIEDRIPGARETMQFLRKLAGALAKQNEALQWPTPSGFPWANHYDNFDTTIIASQLLGLRVRRKLATDYKPDIDADHARSAAAPNFIHGLDAAHLARTGNACVAAGIYDLMTIHDCYGVMAPQAEQFNKIVRAEFVRMYEQHDPLTEIRDCALRSLRTGNDLRAKGQRVTKVVNFEKPGWCAVPERGDLDLRKFLNTPYAFAP